jgi:hypothetical protein
MLKAILAAIINSYLTQSLPSRQANSIQNPKRKKAEEAKKKAKFFFLQT